MVMRTDLFGILAPFGTLAFTLFVSSPSPAENDHLLYKFCSKYRCGDGGMPHSDLVADSKGNLFGTTFYGGNLDCDPSAGCGTVFELKRNGKLKVLHAFQGGNDGAHPYAGLTMDKSGNLFGTTVSGGNFYCRGAGCGTVFRITLDGTMTILHSFQANGTGNDGAAPYSGLAIDGEGNLYGTTTLGEDSGCGIVFALTPAGSEAILGGFDCRDGAHPIGGVVRDASGNLYGTTSGGGAYGYGTIFKIDRNDDQTLLYSFRGSDQGDGSDPEGTLITDNAGNFYGTTASGGTSSGGTVFEFATDGTESILHSFAGADGATPVAGLIADAQGNFYGTTQSGGGAGPFGTVFRLTPDGHETVLHAFTGSPKDGAQPGSGLLLGADNNLYGTTQTGGGNADSGIVFKLKK